ncbi:uncharacterized protein LOC127251327 [Andrographis paniculata]|uniref:uncharacterized protein LOC127251327 n=1 Tax=Andrographis paniculata TaxID=175694 RepID=UPI0021E84408|nr:uncharacterized protein LOC127251327 [Andrographis paniculata]
MAASASAPSECRSRTNNGSSNGGNNGGGGGGGRENANRGGGVPPTEKSMARLPSRRRLRHNPGLADQWSSHEQATLVELLSKHSTEPALVRYAMVSQALRDKTVRDVALRHRWMSRRENGKRRKEALHSSKKSKEKKQKNTESLPKTSQPGNITGLPPHAQPVEIDDGMSLKDIGGVTGQLLEQSAQAMDQISANFSAYKLQDNISLFCQARANILSILNDLNEVPEIMKQMPPIPVKLNEELANTVLGRPPTMPNKP